MFVNLSPVQKAVSYLINKLSLIEDELAVNSNLPSVDDEVSVNSAIPDELVVFEIESRVPPFVGTLILTVWLFSGLKFLSNTCADNVVVSDPFELSVDGEPVLMIKFTLATAPAVIFTDVAAVPTVRSVFTPSTIVKVTLPKIFPGIV